MIRDPTVFLRGENEPGAGCAQGAEPCPEDIVDATVMPQIPRPVVASLPEYFREHFGRCYAQKLVVIDIGCHNKFIAVGTRLDVEIAAQQGGSHLAPLFSLGPVSQIPKLFREPVSPPARVHRKDVNQPKTGHIDLSHDAFAGVNAVGILAIGKESGVVFGKRISAENRDALAIANESQMGSNLSRAEETVIFTVAMESTNS